VAGECSRSTYNGCNARSECSGLFSGDRCERWHLLFKAGGSVFVTEHLCARAADAYGVTAVVEFAPAMPRIAPAKIESRLSALTPIPKEGAAFEYYLGAGAVRMQEHANAKETMNDASLPVLPAERHLQSRQDDAEGDDVNLLEEGRQVARGALSLSSRSS
jgi:hypothetical protein